MIIGNYLNEFNDNQNRSLVANKDIMTFERMLGSGNDHLLLTKIVYYNIGSVNKSLKTKFPIVEITNICVFSDIKTLAERLQEDVHELWLNNKSPLETLKMPYKPIITPVLIKKELVLIIDYNKTRIEYHINDIEYNQKRSVDINYDYKYRINIDK